jgi:voltage-gated sodium channel
MMATVAARAVGGHGGLDQVVAGVIVFNIVVLAASLIVNGHERQFEFVHNLVLAFFVVELAVRFRKAGWRRFFIGRWNCFDAAVIALSVLPVLGVDAALLRVARMARMVHLMRHARWFAVTVLTVVLHAPPRVWTSARRVCRSSAAA